MSSFKLFGKESNPELDALRQKVALLNAEARENFDDPQWRRERAQEMTETIYEGFEHENLLSLMAEVENLPFDGRSFVKEVRGLKAFWVARGGHIEASTLNADVMEITRDTVGFHVTEFEEKMETNFAETSATLVDLAVRRMDAAVNQRVFSLFQAAIPSSSPYYVSGTSVSLAALNSALTAVRDASRTREVVIVGRPTMTEQIMDELLGASYNGSGFLPATNEEMVSRGLLGTYRGASIISLTNYLDENEEPFIPGNEMYVISTDASKFAFWGGMKSKEYMEDDNWYWHYIGKKDFGGVVHRPDRVRRFVDTSISA
jgi:hypothetical protein